MAVCIAGFYFPHAPSTIPILGCGVKFVNTVHQKLGHIDIPWKFINLFALI